MNYHRIVFERGVELALGHDGSWRSTSIQATEISPQAVIDDLGLKPVVLYSKVSESGDQERDLAFLAPPVSGRSLTIEINDFMLQPFDNADVKFTDVATIQTVVGGVHHHCISLAERYCSASKVLTNGSPPGFLDKIERCVLGHMPEPYYEFEALMSVARRAYDALRHIIWKTYSPPKAKSVPASFPKLLKACDGIPRELGDELEDSWRKTGIRVKAYRDCIHHYVPIGGFSPYGMMEKRNHEIWTVSARIPDNPECKSVKKFVFDQNLDALELGWHATAATVSLAAKVIDAVRPE